MKYTQKDIMNWCKKISEICQIPKRYGLWVNEGDLDSYYVLKTNKTKYSLIATYRYWVEDEALRNLLEFSFVDFTNTDNWLNLMELVRTEKLNVWGESAEGLNVQHHFRYNSLKEEMLYMVYFLLGQQPIPPQYGNKFNTFLDNIKSKIQQFDWLYVDDSYILCKDDKN